MKTLRLASSVALALTLVACGGDDDAVALPTAEPAAVSGPSESAPTPAAPKSVDVPAPPKPSLEEDEGVTLPEPKAFEPSQLADLAMWLRADTGVTMDASARVVSWADRSPNHNDATAMMDLAPTMTKLPSSGLPAVQFNGSQFMTIADSASLQWKGDFTVIVLASSVQKEGTQGWLYGKTASSSGQPGPALIVNYPSNKKGADLHVFAARIDENTVSTWDNVNADDGSLHIFMMGRAGTTMFVSFDGEPVHAIDVGKAKDTAAVGAVAAIGEGFEGSMGELIALQHAMTEDETKALVDYAVARYNPNK